MQRRNLFIEFLRATWGIWLYVRYRPTVVNHEVVKGRPGPFLILGNHVMNADPMLISRYIDQRVHYVANDAVFRSPVMAFFMKLVGGIPKSKSVNDMETIRHVMDIRRDGGVIGIFPEGQTSWDGRTGPIIESTAKLVRLLKIPVIAAINKGGYLAFPRWALKRRKGPIQIEFSQILSVEEIKQLDVDGIYTRIRTALNFDASAFARDKGLDYISKRGAEGLERALYACPRCSQFGTLETGANRLSCRNCGYRAIYDSRGHFVKENPDSDGAGPIFTNMGDWGDWQRKLLAKHMEASSTERQIIGDRVRIFTGYRRKKMIPYCMGSMQLYADRLEICPRLKKQMHIPLAAIGGASIFKQDRLEFYFEGTLYRCTFPGRKSSALIYLDAINGAIDKPPELP